MPFDEPQTWFLLRSLDDPEHLERPRGHDRGAARRRFDQLAARVNRRFHCTCTVESNVEDASHHGRIVIPATATAGAEHITVTISNFGDLAAVTLGNPGTYDEDEERELFLSADRRPIERELEAGGYLAVAEHPLWATYDGVSDLASRYSPEHPPTWWTRFFDYL